MKRIAKKTLNRMQSGQPTVIVAFGDSLTEGYEVTEGFVAFWEEGLRALYPGADLRMINAGRSGDTTFDAVDRLRPDVIAHKPHLVTVQFGINDCFSTVYRSEFRENLQWIIRRIEEESAAEILLMTSVLTPNGNDNDALARYYGVIADFAAEYRLPLFRMDAIWRREMRNGAFFDALTLADGVHPSVEGHRLIADELLKEFEEAGSKAAAF